MKKTVIFDFANIGIVELIKELRNRDLNCIGFNEKTQFLIGDLRNKKYVQSFGAFVFISEESSPSRIVQEYMNVLNNNVPIIYSKKDNTTTESLYSCLKGLCCEWSLMDEYTNICNELKKTVAPDNIICDVSYNFSSVVSALIAQKVYGDNIKYIYRCTYSWDDLIMRDVASAWQKSYGIVVEPLQTQNIFNPWPDFESNEQMEKYFEENNKAIKNLFYTLTGSEKPITGYITGTENEFDGMFPKPLKNIYTDFEHPGYKIPLIQPTKNLFNYNLYELANYLQMPDLFIESCRKAGL